MSDPFKRELSVNINTNVDTKSLQNANNIMSDFVKRYDGKQVELGLDLKRAKVDAKDFNRMLDGFKDATKEIENVKLNSPTMMPALQKEIAAIDEMKEKLKSAFVVYQDGSSARGFDEIMAKKADGYSAVLVDMGERVQYLRSQISDALNSLKSFAGIQTNYHGTIDIMSGNMDAGQIKERIELVKELFEYQKELEEFNGKAFSWEDSPIGARSSSMNSYINGLQKDHDALEKYNLKTTEQLQRRKELIDSVQSSYTWDDGQHDNAKQNIKDDYEYNDAIESLKWYIQVRRDAIDQLKENEAELFAVDGISKYVEEANQEIHRLEGCMKELEDLRSGKTDAANVDNISNIDLQGVVEQLGKIEQAIIDIRDAFKPLTDALSSEDNALHKMVTSSIDDLNQLEARLTEVYANIETISKKKFTNQTVVTNAAPASSAKLEEDNRLQSLQEEGLALLRTISYINDLITNNGKAVGIAISGKGDKMSRYAEGFAGFGPSSGEFSEKDLQSGLYGAGTLNQMRKQLGALEYYKEIIIEASNAITKEMPEFFNGLSVKGLFDDVIKDVRAKQQAAIQSAADANIVDATKDTDVVDEQKAQSDIEKLKGTLESELTSIRTKIEEVFNLSTVNFGDEAIQTKISNIYDMFADLETKVKQLDFAIQIPESVIDAVNRYAAVSEKASESAKETQTQAEGAADGIKKEEEAAESAIPDKNKFADANENVADSMKTTGASGEIAADGIKAETQAVEQNKRAWDVVRQVTDGDGNDLFETRSRSSVGQKSVNKKTESWSYNQDKDEWSLDTVTYIQDYKAFEKLQTDAKKKTAKAEATLKKFLSQFDNKTANKWSNTGVYAELKGFMDSGIKDVRQIDDVLNKMQLLDSEYNEAVSFLRQGTKSMNPFVNAFTGIDEMKDRVAQAQIGFDGLSKSSDDLKRNVDSLPELLKKLNDALKPDENGVVNIMNVAKAYGNLNATLKQISSGIATQKQQITAEEKQQKDFDNLIKKQEKIYDLRKQLVGVDPESAKGLELTRELTKATEEYGEALANARKEFLTAGQNQTLEANEAQYKKEVDKLTEEKRSNKQQKEDSKYIKSVYKQYTDAMLSLKKMNLDPSDAVHNAAAATAIKEAADAKAELLAYGVDVNNMVANELVSEKIINELLEDRVKYLKQMKNIEDSSKDKAETKEERQNKKYGNTIYNRETRYKDQIDTNIRAIEDRGLSNDFEAKIQKYRQAYKELDDAKKAIENNPNASKAMKEDFQDAALEVEKLRKEILGVVKDINKLDAIEESDAFIKKALLDEKDIDNVKHSMIELAGSILNGQGKILGFNASGTEMYAIMHKGQGIIENVTIALKEGTNELIAYRTNVANTGTAWDTFLSKVSSNAKTAFKYLVSGFGVQDIVRYVKQGIQEVRDIDSALTELKKVTNETDEAYDAFLQTMSKSAGAVGGTVKDLTTSAADWSRLGYSIKEAESLAKNTAILMNVSEFDDVNKATDTLISALQAYKNEATDVGAYSMQIIDEFNEVGNSYAISTADLASSLTRSSAALAAANNSLEQSIALTTAANTIIQNPESVGNALKVVSMRVRGVKTELEAAGEETEGMVTNTAKLQEKIEALTNIDGTGGINILTATGDFKSTYDILLEISKVWDKIGDMDQAALLELIAGKQRGSVVAGLLSNGDIIESAYESASNATGSAQDELYTHLNSIEGRIDKFNNALQTMWMNTLDDSVIKWFVDLGTSVITFVDKVGVLNTALIGVLGYFLAIKKNNPFAIVQDLNNQMHNMSVAKNQISAMQGLGLGTGKLDASGVNAYATAISNLTAKQQALILASAGVSKQQAVEIMTKNGLTQENIEQALSEANLVTAKTTATTVTVQEALATTAAADAKQEEALANFIAANSTKTLTYEMIQELAQKGTITAATGAEIAAKYGLVAANSAVATSIKGIGTAIKGLFMSNPVGWILTIVSALATLISSLKSTSEKNQELIQEAKQVKEAYATQTDEINKNIKAVSDLEEEFAKLSKGVDDYGKNISLSADDYARYQEIVSTIVGLSPSLVEGYDAEGNAIANKNSLLQSSIDLLEEEQRLKAKQYLNSDNRTTLTDGAVASLEEELANVDIPQTIANATEVLEDGKISGGRATNIDEYIASVIGVEKGSESIDEYIQENYKAIQDNLGEILHVASQNFIDSDGKEYLGYNQYQLEDFETYLYSVISATDKASEEIRSFLQVVPQARTGYSDLNNASKEFLNQYIDTFGITTNTTDDDIAEMENKIREFSDFLIQNAEVENIIEIGYALNAGTDEQGEVLSVAEYRKQIENFKKDITDSAYTEDQKNVLLSLFGLDDDDQMDNDIEKAVAHAKNLLQDEFDGSVDGLSVNDVLITMKITEDPNGLTIDELKQKIQEIRGSFGSDIVGIQTYSDITEFITNYNEALQQTSEIVLDNTEVTQEYKDALLALGISSEELNECFHESNPLIVRNANALNNLVKSSKDNTLQNAKLAKSQAKLQYYELYQKLKNLTGGQKILSASTLAQVKSLYAEMSALQKTISKYSMLEHKLLGAANAYEEFAKAQEIDSENDYESKAEEMVGYLVDAFHTGKLGAEAAQTAIKGLVPESVYEDLDTLDDKMQAVYDYFTTDLSKYFYVKFNEDGSLESAEMLIDNVKQFVEDGIDNGVFTGSWEEWDLSSSINSLDELAKQMGVTKEVTYAFLQSMETYDISWIGGDASTLLDKLLPSSQELKAFGQQMQEAYETFGLDSDIDLTQRVKVSREIMLDKGWDIGDDEYATVNSISAYASEFGLSDEYGNDYAINLTPILPDGTVIEGGEDEFKKWINEQLAGGKTLDDLNIVLGTYGTMDEAVKQAEALHKAQEDYYAMIDSYSLENEIYANTQKQAELQYKIGTGQINADTIVGADGVTTAGDQLAQLNVEAEENAAAARENVSSWTDAQEAYDKAAEYVNLLNNELKKASDAGDEQAVKRYQKALESAEGTLWSTYSALAKIGEPTEVVLTVAMEQVQKDLNALKETMSNEELDIVSSLDISNLKKDGDGNWIVDIDAYSQLDEESKARVQQYLDYLSEEHDINILQGEGAITTLDVLTEIKDILSQTYELMVETSDAQTKAQSFADVWNGIKDKAVTLTQSVVEFFTRTPKDDGGSDINGNAHLHGTAHANGTWGADKSETALMGELGEELIVRGNKFFTVGSRGAEFFDVQKGDIIFNHKQTKSLLENGYVTGRGKLHGGSAFASGTAYAPGAVHPWTGGMNIGGDWSNITPTLWDAATNGEYLSDSMSDAADSVGEFEETIDWIEIRMEEFDERIGKLSAELENLTTYAAKNAKIDEIIAQNQQKYADSLAGAAYYEEYAKKYLSGMNDDLVAAAKNGAIAITEFTKEQDEATVNAIQNYREYAQKAADLYQQAEEILTEIRDSVIQKIDNIQSYGEVKTAIEDLQTDRLQNIVDYIEKSGRIASPVYYGENGGNADNSTGMFENSYKKIDYWTPVLEDMQKSFNEAVKNGHIKVGTVEWYEQLEKLYNVQAEIDAATMEIEEFQNAINDLYWDNFDELINRIDYLNDETESLIDLMGNKDLLADPAKKTYKNGTVEYWTEDDVKWTDEGLASLGLYAQQMEIAEFKSKQYAEAIDDLTKEYNAGHYSENEYYEKLNELTQAQYDSIESYYDAQDAIKDLNKTRIDSIKDGIEKEIEAYEELINKQKESLQADKD